MVAPLGRIIKRTTMTTRERERSLKNRFWRRQDRSSLLLLMLQRTNDFLFLMAVFFFLFLFHRLIHYILFSRLPSPLPPLNVCPLSVSLIHLSYTIIHRVCIRYKCNIGRYSRYRYTGILYIYIYMYTSRLIIT